MRIATCRWNGISYIGVASGTSIALVAERSNNPLDWPDAGALANPRHVVPMEQVEFLPPVASAKILCVGLNYRDHTAEAGLALPDHPSIFVRFADSVVGHRQAILSPSISGQFDYEGELAVIIGRAAWRVDREVAMAHVAGYACFAENSVRDFQAHSRQVTAGKNFFASGAFGPWLTTSDEVPDPAVLQLTTRLNGEVVQHASLGSLIFDIPALISYVSQFTPLHAGDVIATGTPANVGAARTPQLWLKPGDTLEVEIPGVGHLVNRIEADSCLASQSIKDA